jgi:hypothetical protein
VNISGNGADITSSEYQDHSISAYGSINLKGGSSHGNIYYRGSASIDSTWKLNGFRALKFDDLYGYVDSRELIGQQYYLNSLTQTTGVDIVHTATEYKVTVKSSLYYATIVLDASKLVNVVKVTISSRSNAKLIVVLKGTGSYNLNNITFNTSVKPENLLIASVASSINLNNTTIPGSLYAALSNIVINNSTVTGTLVASNLGLESGSIKVADFTGDIPSKEPPTIEISPISSIDNTEPVEVYITSGDASAFTGEYSIRYTLDGSTPTLDSTEYTGPFEVYNVGMVLVKATIFGLGVVNGNTATQAYGFTCKADNPSISLDSNGMRIFNVLADKVYYTINGSDPEIGADGQSNL